MPRPKSAARERLEQIAAEHEAAQVAESPESGAASPSPAAATATAATADPSASVQEELLHSTRCIFELLNDHDFSADQWSKHWSPTICCTGLLSLSEVSPLSSTLPVSEPRQFQTLEEILSLTRAMAEKYPEWRTEVLDMNCEVDLARRIGRVYATSKTSGIFGSVVQTEVTIHEFAEEGGVWRVVGLRTMSGGGM